MRCPECGAICEADFVDNGVGNQRVSPWRCPECHWIEPTPPRQDDPDDNEPF